MKVIKIMGLLILLGIIGFGLLVFYGLHHNNTPVRKHSRIIRNRVKPGRWTKSDDEALIDEMDKFSNQ